MCIAAVDKVDRYSIDFYTVINYNDFRIFDGGTQ